MGGKRSFLLTKVGRNFRVDHQCQICNAYIDPRGLRSPETQAQEGSSRFSRIPMMSSANENAARRRALFHLDIGHAVWQSAPEV